MLMLCYVLLPINDILILQITNLIIAVIFVLLFPKIDTLLLALFIFLSIWILVVNLLTFNTSIEIFKPIISLFILLCFSGYLKDKNLDSEVNCQTLIWMIAGSAAIIYARFDRGWLPISWDSEDLYHRGRLTAPFLFAGDLANALLLLAFASYSSGRSSFSKFIWNSTNAEQLGYLAVVATAYRVMTPGRIVMVTILLSSSFMCQTTKICLSYHRFLGEFFSIFNR